MIPAIVLSVCPHGHFRVALEHASYEVTQNVQVVLVKINDGQPYDRSNKPLRICAGCKTCACQEVAWASRNSSKNQLKVFPLLQWFESFRSTSEFFLQPMNLGAASSFGKKYGTVHAIHSFFVENQDPTCVSGSFSFNVKKIHPDRRTVLLSHGDAIVPSLETFMSHQIFHNTHSVSISAALRSQIYKKLVDADQRIYEEYVSVDTNGSVSVRKPYIFIEDDELNIEIRLTHDNVAVNHTLSYPTVSSEARFCVTVLSFCEKVQLKANNCFEIVKNLKENKLAPSFLPYEPELHLPMPSDAVKNMEILYVVLSDLPHDGDRTSCVVPIDGNFHSLFYYGTDATRIFPAITKAVDKRACCWKWMVLIDCKTNRKVVPNLVFQRLQKYDHSRPYFISKMVASSDPFAPPMRDCGDTSNIMRQNNVDFGLVRNGIALSRAATDLIVPRIKLYESIPYHKRYYEASKTFCIPYFNNEIRLANCLYHEFGWAMLKSDILNDSGFATKQQSRNGNLEKTKSTCKKDAPFIVHGMLGYAGDINKTIEWFTATAALNASCGVKHLFIWDSAGEVPQGVPSTIDLDIIPHPRNIVPNIINGYRFAQIKVVALLLEAATRMDRDEKLTHLILSDNDVVINLPVLESVLQRYMPDGLVLGGDLVDQAIEGGYINGAHFYTRDLVFAIRAYLHAYVGFFPNSFFKPHSPMANVDVAMSSLVTSLGGTLVHLPGAYSISAYCALPLGYLKWPLVTTNVNLDELGVPDHHNVLQFILEGGGN